MFDIKGVEKEARQEIAQERAEAAKGKIKAKLRDIARAERIVVDLREELEVLKRDVAGEV